MSDPIDQRDSNLKLKQIHKLSSAILTQMNADMATLAGGPYVDPGNGNAALSDDVAFQTLQSNLTELGTLLA